MLIQIFLQVFVQLPDLKLRKRLVCENRIVSHCKEIRLGIACRFLQDCLHLRKLFGNGCPVGITCRILSLTAVKELAEKAAQPL